MADSLQKLTEEVKKFRDERNWAQFHTLKDLIISLNLEAAELLELTQWTDEKSLINNLLEDKNKEALEDECADILLYLLLIADKSKIDLINAATKKIAKNAQKYPIAQSFGSKAKYSALKKT